MNVLMIFAPVHPKCDGLNMRSTPPMALYYLSNILEQHGFSVKTVDPYYFREKQFFDEGQDKDKIIKDLFDTHIDVVCLSSNTGNWATSKVIIEYVNYNYNQVPIIVGGVHASYFDEYILKSSPVRYVIRGEGELTLPRLIDALEHQNDDIDIVGVTYKNKQGTIIRNKDSELIPADELQDFPVPCYEKLPKGLYIALPMETSRGCRFNCIFCSVTHRSSWRGFSPENVLRKLNELAPYIRDKLETGKVVYFTDDCFSADPLRAMEILNRIAESDLNYIKLFIECRITDLLYEGFIDRIPVNIIGTIQIGVEAGYDDGLRKVRKGITTQQLEQCVELLYKKGLKEKFFLSFIIGFPWETYEDMIKTIETASSLSKRYGIMVSLGWLIMCPSDLWKAKEQYNINIDESVFDNPLFLVDKDLFFKTHPNVTMEQLEDIEQKIYTCQQKSNRFLHVNPLFIWNTIT